VSWRHELFDVYHKIGDALAILAKAPEALDAYRKALAVIERLAESGATASDWQHDVWSTYNKIGDIQTRLNRKVEALDSYRKALATIGKLCDAAQCSPIWQTDLVLALYKVAMLLDPAGARDLLARALVILETLQRDKQLPALQQGWPELLRTALAKLPS
jgi:tetratricopeptide (TPR) repeat protein